MAFSLENEKQGQHPCRWMTTVSELIMPRMEQTDLRTQAISDLASSIRQLAESISKKGTDHE